VGAVARGEVEHAVRAKLQLAAVMPVDVIRLVDVDERAGTRGDRSLPVGAVLDDVDVALYVVVVAEEAVIFLVVRVKGEREQPFLDEEANVPGQIEEGLLARLAVLEHGDHAELREEIEAVGLRLGSGDIGPIRADLVADDGELEGRVCRLFATKGE